VDDVLRPGADARRCIVKARIVRNTARGMRAARLHLAYIERDGVERDGSAGRLYGRGEEIDRAMLCDASPGERHQFRFIVSPEDEIDLTTFTRQLMRRMEDDLGMRLQWGAVNHYNTDNPHAHVVVRGLSEAGREVWIDRAYISERMRWQAQHILTQELGPRPEHVIERQLDREVGLERVTSLDRRLAATLDRDGTTDLARIGRERDERARRRLVGRLQTLETLELARRTGPASWQLDADWQLALRQLAERREIAERVDRVMGRSVDRTRCEVLDGGMDREPFEGVVRRKGLHNELGGEGYAIIETPRGNAAYVRLDLATAESLTEGAVARVSVERQRWAKAIDRVLEQVARENGGVYDAKAHLRDLQRGPIVIEGRTVPAEEILAANARRLARLERHRLVMRIYEHRWRVPADLVKQLEARDISHPRRLVRARAVAPSLERQVTVRGPCWLDMQDPTIPRAPYGLGATLGAAMKERDRFLDGLGIAREPRERRLRALERLQQMDVARDLARQHGVALMPEPVPGLRGRLLALEERAPGAPLAYVLDKANRRMALVPMPANGRELVGRAVTLGRDREGRLLIRPDGLERGL